MKKWPATAPPAKRKNAIIRYRRKVRNLEVAFRAGAIDDVSASNSAGDFSERAA